MRRSCCGDAVVGVADDERHVGALGGALRAQRRVVLDGLGDLRLAPHAGGVDDDDLAPVDLQRQVDRVARRAGDVGDDDAVGADEAVDERGLADVRAPDDGQADERLVDLLVVLGQQLDEAVEQVAGAQALRGGDRHRLAEAEPVRLDGERDVLDAVDLVRGDDDGHPRAAQQVGELVVAGPQAGLGVEDEQRDLRVGERGLGLVADRAGDRVGVLVVHAAGVDQREAPAVPLRGDLLAIARDPGALVDDRLARVRQAVDERGLADVRIADDRDLHRTACTRRAICSTTSSTLSPVVSTRSASAAGCSGECSRVVVARVALELLGEHLLGVGAESARRGGARAPRARR